MPFIEVIKDDKTFHLEMWNEQNIIDLGLAYEIVPINSDFVLSTIEELTQ